MSENFKNLDGKQNPRANDIFEHVEKLYEIILTIHSAISLVMEIKNSPENSELLPGLNKKISDLLLFHATINPAILTEDEHNYINGISSRPQPGLESVLIYGASLWVSISARIKKDLYSQMTHSLKIFKTRLLSDFCMFLREFLEKRDIAILLELQGLAKFFLDNNLDLLSGDLKEASFYVRKIFGFCQMKILEINSLKENDINDLEFILSFFEEKLKFVGTDPAYRPN